MGPEREFGAPAPAERTPAKFRLGELADEIAPLLAGAVGVTWYDDPANEVDVAVDALCKLRRAAAGARRGSEGGDAAVREVLSQASPETVLWIVSRTISYMDEHGFPESFEALSDAS